MILRICKRRVGRQPAAPAKCGVIGKRVIVDIVEAAVADHRLPAVALGTIEIDQLQLLARADVEATLAAVPIAAEDHGLCFGDEQAALGIEVGGNINAVPVQRALRQRAGRQGNDAECNCARGDESNHCFDVAAASSAMNLFMCCSSTGSGTEPIARMASWKRR